MWLKNKPTLKKNSCPEFYLATQKDDFCEAKPSINDNFACEAKPSSGKIYSHERSESRQGIFWVAIKYRALNNPPYKIFHLIICANKRFYRALKIYFFHQVQ